MSATAPRFVLGNWTATCLRDTPYWVDAGTMFGPVPRTDWERCVVPDRCHRMRLELNCLLLRNGTHTILVDTGMGDRFSDHDAAQWSLERGRSILHTLAEEGVDASMVDCVIFTHLHSDHAGGATVRHDGALKPAFPRARHIIQAAEWEAMENPNPVTRDWYDAPALWALREAGLVELVRGEVDLCPEVTVTHTGGHSHGHQAVTVRSGGRVLAVPGDIVPTIHHGHPAWVSAYESEPGTVAEVKARWLAMAAEESWTLFLSHEAAHPFRHATPTGNSGGHALIP